MDNQLFSLLFSLLLTGTFVHEVSAVIGGGITHERTKRAASSGLILESVDELLVVTNSTAKGAFVFDLQNKMYALLNGASGSAIVVTPKSLEKVTIPKGVWKQDDSSLKDVLKSLSNGLKDLTKKDGAVDGISDPDDAAKIIAGLVVRLDKNIMRTPLQAVRLVSQNIFGPLSELLGSPIYELYGLLKDKQVELPSDLPALTNTLTAIEKIFDPLNVNIAIIEDEDVNIPIEKLLGSKNGLEVLVQLITGLGNIKPLAPLGGADNEKPALLALIAQLGGNAPEDINELIQILADIGDIPQHPYTTVKLFNDLMQYVAETPADVLETIRDDLEKVLNDLLDAIEKHNAKNDLHNYVNLINSILENRLKIDDVNHSKIIDLLTKNLKDEEPLTVLLKVVLALEPIFPPVQSIPTFLAVLITKLESDHGVELEKELNIPLDIDVDGIKGSILKSVLSSAGDLQSLKSGNLYDALTKLKVLQDIVKTLEDGLKSADDSLDLKNLLGKNTLIQDVIRAVVQLVSGENLGSSTDDLSDAGIVIANSARLMALTHLEECMK